MVGMLEYLGTDCSTVLQILKNSIQLIAESNAVTQESEKQPALSLCFCVFSQMLDSGRDQRF